MAQRGGLLLYWKAEEGEGLDGQRHSRERKADFGGQYGGD